MIRDADDIPDGQLLQTDICVIGAGAAGISLALQYAGSHISVLLLESGGLVEEPQTQALYAGSVADSRAHSPPERYRQRRFGGTTTIWGGRCMPFDDIDFEPRDFVAHSGWPITRHDILPYYPIANRLCEAGDFVYDAEVAFHGHGRPIIDGFESELFSTNTLERFSCPTDFGARYRDRLTQARNVDVLLHANVTHVQLAAAGGAVAGLEVRTLKGKRFSARARQYVLAVGGLESVRLLLSSRDVQPRGVGNDHDVVGRYYMCHLAGTIGRISIGGPPGAVHHGYELSDEGIYCRRRLALRPEVQRQERLGNFVARLHHPRITDPAHRSAVLSLLFLARPLIPYEYAMRLHGEHSGSVKDWLRHAGNVIRDPLEASGFAWHMVRDRKLAERKFPSIIVQPKTNLFSLDFHAEQQPNPQSRVTLAPEVDALGMPRLHIDWRYLSSDLDTVDRALALLRGEFQRSGVGTFDYDPASVESELTRYGAYGGHHIGTARMGTNPADSVVDADCNVHGVENLYIAGSAAFPTSSQANPTLTVVAMALRLAEHLKRRLATAPLAVTGDAADRAGIPA